MAGTDPVSSSEESPELAAALDDGEVPDLPPNVPPGLLGDQGLNLRKVDPDRHGLNSGLSQEMDGPVVLLLVVATYAIFFPLAFYILWRTPTLPRHTKITLSAVMAVGVLLAAWYLLFVWRPA
jgi:hypothetical protein